MNGLREYCPNQIWVQEYPIHYAGTRFNARMTIIRLSDGRLLMHSPCEIDRNTQTAIKKLGELSYIVAPGSYHYLYVPSAQQAFPEAETFICPGIERKNPQLKFDWILGDKTDLRWQDDFKQVLVRGSKYMWEVAFYHKASKTLLLVDLIENMTDQTEGLNMTLKLWWKWVFHMWNHPKPAPEYQIGWQDKQAAAASLNHILTWDFERIIISHGDLIEYQAKEVARQAWQNAI